VAYAATAGSPSRSPGERGAGPAPSRSQKGSHGAAGQGKDRQDPQAENVRVGIEAMLGREAGHLSGGGLRGQAGRDGHRQRESEDGSGSRCEPGLSVGPHEARAANCRGTGGLAQGSKRNNPSPIVPR